MNNELPNNSTGAALTVNEVRSLLGLPPVRSETENQKAIITEYHCSNCGGNMFKNNVCQFCGTTRGARRHSLTDEQMQNIYDEFYESFSSAESMRIYNELNDD